MVDGQKDGFLQTDRLLQAYIVPNFCQFQTPHPSYNKYNISRLYALIRLSLPGVTLDL